MQSTIDQRSGELSTIPLSLLIPSPRNVRKTGGSDVGELKASIKAQGVLQNLIVCPAENRKGKPNGKYEVVGGRRRLQALSELAAEGDISLDEEILCRIKPTRDAAEASLAENIAREPMHPADEFEAFKTLIEEGKTVEEVAARFGTSALTVRRRLKLASLHPVLLAQYREDRIALDQLMALALTDDQAEQLRVWERVTRVAARCGIAAANARRAGDRCAARPGGQAGRSRSVRGGGRCGSPRPVRGARAAASSRTRSAASLGQREAAGGRRNGAGRRVVLG